MDTSGITVIVGSTNPVKLHATNGACKAMFPVVEIETKGINVPSGVPSQPVGDGQTRLGAKNRCLAAKEKVPDATLWVGIEGGIETIDTVMIAFAWIAVCGQDGKVRYGRTSTFVLPMKVASLVGQGMELGSADDVVFGTKDSKRSMGAVGILTNGKIDRTQYYQQAVMLALIPFVKADLYTSS